MNHIEIKKIDYDCYKVIVDGSALGNELNAGYFTRHDIQCLGDACQTAMMDEELTGVVYEGAPNRFEKYEGDY